MLIGNNMGISNGYQNNASKAGGYKSVREYSKYLMGKYDCLTPGSNVAVSVTPGMLRKAMTDEKTGKWLERELGKAPDYIKQAKTILFSLLQELKNAKENRLDINKIKSIIKKIEELKKYNLEDEKYQAEIEEYIDKAKHKVIEYVKNAPENK